jgi:hypothetical protein
MTLDGFARIFDDAYAKSAKARERDGYLDAFSIDDGLRAVFIALLVDEDDTNDPIRAALREAAIAATKP